MKKIWLIVFILLLSLNMAIIPNMAYAKPQAHCISQSETTFKNQFRRLWFDHVLWTSNYITSATTAGSKDQQQVLARLLQNQKEIGNSIKPVYGEKAGNKLADLLTEHIVIAGKIVDAAKKGNKPLVDKLNKDWYKNADDIAVFLSGANPNLNKEDLRKLLYMHLKLVTDDLSASLASDWGARIVSIDDGVTHIILMADAISSAVVKQFPNKFK
ncbi:glycosyltransferase [Falsibacillus pallidus]|uniref:glycosyltransferase n=1 Tax=Falsibacillus pallidus TaxID=493781 RepID=UPI003D980DBF